MATVTHETLKKLINAFEKSTKLQSQLLQTIQMSQASQSQPIATTAPVTSSLKFEEFQSEKESISIYLERLKVYLQLPGINSESEAHQQVKKNVLLSSIGSTHFQVMKDLCLPSEVTDKSFKELCTLIEDHYNLQTNIFIERN